MRGSDRQTRIYFPRDKELLANSILSIPMKSLNGFSTPVNQDSKYSSSKRSGEREFHNFKRKFINIFLIICRKNKTLQKTCRSECLPLTWPTSRIF